MKLMYLLLLVVAAVQLALASVTVYDKNNNTLTTYDSLSAAFGPHISDDGLQGYVAVANPSHACTKIDPPPSLHLVDTRRRRQQPTDNNKNQTWIALIVRTPTGNCSFDLKVKNAQLAGYQAVIIYNSDSDNLIKMSSSGLIQIKIPSVFVGHTSGVELSKYYTYQNGTYVVINNDDTDLNYLLIPFISVVCICFLVAVCIFVVKLALHCHKVRKNRVPRSALKKLPTKKYQKTDKYDTCPICLNEYEEGVKIRMLPCEHAYHVDCIDKWLLRNNRFCPVCKRRALPGGESSSESESESGGTTQRTTSQRVVNETRANEDEDTNESTRLLVVSQRGDTDSVTSQNVSMIHSTNPNSGLLATGQQSDMNSLNNHMTMSMASSATNNLASSSFNNPTMMNTTNLIATSSKYGSISSINNMGSVVNEAFVKEDDVDSGDDVVNKITGPHKENERTIDSKQTPDYYTPREHLFPTESNDTTASAAATASKQDQVTKSKSKKKKKKSKSAINNETVSKIATELAAQQQKEDQEDQEIVDERFHSVMDDDDKLLDDK